MPPCFIYHVYRPDLEFLHLSDTFQFAAFDNKGRCVNPSQGLTVQDLSSHVIMTLAQLGYSHKHGSCQGHTFLLWQVVRQIKAIKQAEGCRLWLRAVCAEVG